VKRGSERLGHGTGTYPFRDRSTTQAEEAAFLAKWDHVVDPIFLLAFYVAYTRANTSSERRVAELADCLFALYAALTIVCWWSMVKRPTPLGRQVLGVLQFVLSGPFVLLLLLFLLFRSALSASDSFIQTVAILWREHARENYPYSILYGYLAWRAFFIFLKAHADRRS
jgi:hypothetical protein